MVLGALSGRLVSAGASQGGRLVATQTGRAALGGGAAGAAGGVLLDDVPLVGPVVDPTETQSGVGGDGSSFDVVTGGLLLMVLGLGAYAYIQSQQ